MSTISHIPPLAPDGRLTVVITYLEMMSAPSRVPAPTPLRKLALLRAEAMPLHFYRYLYNTVGEPWLWYERRIMNDATLAKIVQDERVEIYVLYADGAPAGYAELDRRQEGEIELAYFGLIPERIGRGLGAYLLNCVVDTAWRYEPRRLWVHTCNLDHPRALQTYQRAGFVAYKQEAKDIEDPRASGAWPANAGGST